MDRLEGVAGVNAPAFVERSRTLPGPRWASSVAGVNAPAFVERASRKERIAELVSVAGVNAPAFVERPAYALRRSLPPRVSLGWTSGSSASNIRIPRYLSFRISISPFFSRPRRCVLTEVASCSPNPSDTWVRVGDRPCLRTYVFIHSRTARCRSVRFSTPSGSRGVPCSVLPLVACDSWTHGGRYLAPDLGVCAGSLTVRPRCLSMFFGL